jgi:homoserine kinase
MASVRAPATTANLGSGYDVFGAALEQPADVVTVEPAPETSIDVTGVGARFIPEDPADNVAGAVADALGVSAHVHIDKGVRPSSGLGSSAASAAGTALALNAEYDLGHSRRELVAAAAEGEAVAAGTAHRDNVTPALLGGFTLVGDDRITQVDAAVPLVVCLPDLAVSTRDARTAVPDRVDLSELVETVGNAGTLVAGMFRDDPGAVGAGMDDPVVTPVRSSLIEGYESVRAAATDAGATGVTVSGAGPAVVAACYRTNRRAVAGAMVDAFSGAGIEASAYQTEIGDGATVLA